MKPAVDLRHLPGILGQLAARGHGGAAVRLIMEWGGTKRYIPAQPGPRSALVAVIGMAAAQVLAEIRGAEHYDIPSIDALEPTLKGEILRRSGTTREVARALGCTERYVRKVRSGGAAGRLLQKGQGDPRQPRLFD